MSNLIGKGSSIASFDSIAVLHRNVPQVLKLGSAKRRLIHNILS